MNPQIEKRLASDKSKIDQALETSSQVLRLFPFELKEISEIQAKVNDHNLKFIDITFPPSDESAFW
jgi:hypothetical protein